MKKIFDFIKKDVVLIIALFLGIASLIVARPTWTEVSGFIDFRVLAILLSLMLVMEGFKSTGLFASIAKVLIDNCSSKRGVELILIFLCFFSSMLITNDVALITFVPFAITSLSIAGRREKIVPVVVFQTIAANLGSMFTPLGNPQNLFLFNLMNCKLQDFLILMLPYVVLAMVMLLLFTVIRKKTNPCEDIKPVTCESDNSYANQISKRRKTVQNLIYLALFIVCLLCVLKAIPYYIMLGVVVIALLIVNHHLFIKADYGLLFTFIGFFLFIGSMGKFEPVNVFLSSVVSGRETLIGVLSSQVISNVPAAVLLSNYSNSLSELVIGVNIGGLGTLIASMASLISYKQIVKALPDKKNIYFVRFTIFNIIFLAAEIGLYYIIKALQ